jgi:hypothetical protein
MSIVTEEVMAKFECGCGPEYGGEGRCGCRYTFKKRDLQVNIC